MARSLLVGASAGAPLQAPGLVIAESFSEAEYDAAKRLGIECLRASIDRRGRARLAAVASVPSGPVAEAPERPAKRRRRRH